MNRPIPAISLGLLLAAMPVSANDAEVRERIASRIPGVSAADVNPSPIDGLYEVTLGPRIVYASADGRYVLQGAIVDLDAQTNITEPRRTAARARWVNGLDEAQMVIFEPTAPLRHTVTVFTDIDCAYCRQMHSEIGALLAGGVRVRYLLYSRGGPGTDAARKAEHVWCAPDRRAALTAAKLGRSIAARECETPLMANLLLGRELNVTGTPTLVSDGGDLIPGYLPPATLIEELQRLAAAR